MDGSQGKIIKCRQRRRHGGKTDSAGASPASDAEQLPFPGDEAQDYPASPTKDVADHASVKDEIRSDDSDTDPHEQLDGALPTQAAAEDARPGTRGFLRAAEAVLPSHVQESPVAGVEDPKLLWSKPSTYVVDDDFGYGRIPAFWFTLNLPYNYLFEIHRFQHAVLSVSQAPSPADEELGKEAPHVPDAETTRAKDTVDCLDPLSGAAMAQRCEWVLNNPDIVVMLHAIRVEIMVEYVMKHIVPYEEEDPFQYWLRFEFGTSGNPHTHGIAYVAGNPEFDMVVKDSERLLAVSKKLQQEGHPDWDKVVSWETAERSMAEFYHPYINEMHPCKDSSGAPLWKYGSAMYELVLENVPLPGCAKPQTVNLLELLENVFSSEEPDTSPLKHVLLALIESGQRHDYHEHGPPEFGKHSCARKGTTEDGKDYVYCRYLYPRRIQQFTPPDYGHVEEDPPPT